MEDYAKADGSWIDYGEARSQWEPVGAGAEAEVFTDDGHKTVSKIIAYDAADPLTPLEFIDNRISLHNALFPNVAYTLEGFTRNNAGKLCFVLRQPYVQNEGGATFSEVSDYLEKYRGMASARGSAYLFANPDYILSDLHLENVIKGPEGILYFIDAIPQLNIPAEGLGGVRQYQPFTVEDAAPSGIQEQLTDKTKEHTSPQVASVMARRGMSRAEVEQYLKTKAVPDDRAAAILKSFDEGTQAEFEFGKEPEMPADEVQEAFDKQERDVNAHRKSFKRRLYESYVKGFEDTKGVIKERLREAGATEAVVLLNLTNGAGQSAKEEYTRMREAVHGDLSITEIKVLNNIVQARRIITDAVSKKLTIGTICGSRRV